MTQEAEPPIHPDVRKLVEDITEMADAIRQPFVADPEKVRRYNDWYVKSLDRNKAGPAASN